MKHIPLSIHPTYRYNPVYTAGMEKSAIHSTSGKEETSYNNGLFPEKTDFCLLCLIKRSLSFERIRQR